MKKREKEPGKEIEIPHRFVPRGYQLDFLRHLDQGLKRAVIVWHRRAGKDKTSFNFMIAKMWDRVGSYYYFFPEFAQGRRVLWEGADKEGMRFLDHFPEVLVKRKNEAEMKVELKNGSIFQIIGTDKFDKKVIGTNVVGCVFSEYPLQDPDAWNYVRPILRENDGWAIFCFTPRGRQNHAYDLYRMAVKNGYRNTLIPFGERWYHQLLTVEDTGVLSRADIEVERREGTPEEIIQQEYYCSFSSANVGNYYGKEMLAAAERITFVPYEKSLPVDTYWDIGLKDPTAIWFIQRSGSRYLAVDYLENSGESMDYYARELRGRGYAYGEHFAPHDIEQREYSTGVSRKDIARNLGISFRVVPKLDVQSGIDLARMILGKVFFDEQKCRRGVECLANYRKEWDEKNKCFRSFPDHDWASNGADAFRVFAVAASRKENVERVMSYQRPFRDQNLEIWRNS